MRWIRFKIRDLDKVVFPDQCPNCGCSPARCPINLSRSVGTPLLFQVSVHAVWFVCNDCDAWLRRMRWRKRLWVWAPAIAALIGAAFLTTFGSVRPRGSSSLVFWIVWGAIGYAAVGATVAMLHRRFARPTGARIANRILVRPIRGGRDVLTGRDFLHIEFMHPLYAEDFAEINDPDNITYSDRRLTKAIEHWH